MEVYDSSWIDKMMGEPELWLPEDEERKAEPEEVWDDRRYEPYGEVESPFSDLLERAIRYGTLWEV
ncbi:hypothetical protein SAMN06269117_11436 [Balnearium lithotrophicum]|uniref:Uncharacterized protein n=1 Tax=Balnearium lithotrophicum TaxID=223788 RepID=A0A521CPA3_9BACT|nr:hypothetical protein [Balnearium lithotrophicum]SMO61228.1 hypothetical protein SAMN06269117_11436 [Balnearium lithotrophicum]